MHTGPKRLPGGGVLRRPPLPRAAASPGTHHPEAPVGAAEEVNRKTAEGAGGQREAASAGSAMHYALCPMHSAAGEASSTSQVSPLGRRAERQPRRLCHSPLIPDSLPGSRGTSNRERSRRRQPEGRESRPISRLHFILEPLVGQSQEERFMNWIESEALVYAGLAFLRSSK